MTCLFVGCGIWSAGMADELSTMPYFSTWPQIHSAITRDEGMEHQIQALLSRMTLEEKVGQMIQPDFREVTPEEVTRYKIGSVLNGGGLARQQQTRVGPGLGTPGRHLLASGGSGL